MAAQIDEAQSLPDPEPLIEALAEQSKPQELIMILVAGSEMVTTMDRIIKYLVLLRILRHDLYWGSEKTTLSLPSYRSAIFRLLCANIFLHSVVGISSR